MRPTHLVLVTVLAALAATGCASKGASRSSQPSGGRVITAEQIARWNVLTAYEVVERAGGYTADGGSGGGVRQRRGRSSIQNANADRPVLVLDNVVLSDGGVLRQIRAHQLARIEVLTGADATARYGTGGAAGAILVFTRTQ